MEIVLFRVPIPNFFADNFFSRRAEIAGNAEAGLGFEGKEELLEQFVVSVGGFDKKLGHIPSAGFFFEVLDFFNLVNFQNG